jgi:hypothetical protein
MKWRRCWAVFTFDVERDLEGLTTEEDRYVKYCLDVVTEIEPADGDGWNEPRTRAFANVCTATVRFCSIHEAERSAVWELRSIGPVEPGVIAPGCQVELTPEEEEAMETVALEPVEPDPDEAYERRMDR